MYFIGHTLVAAGACLLLWSAYGHGADLDRLRSTLIAQGVPYSLHKVIAGLLITLESIAGLSALISPHLHSAPGLTQVALMSLQAVLYSIFATYALFLLWTRKDVPCGCFSGDERVSTSTVFRASLFSAATFALLNSSGISSRSGFMELSAQSTGLVLAGSARLATIANVTPRLERSQ